jgi:toxin YoeB
VRTVEFDPSAFDDLAWWAEQDRAQAIRIIRLVRDTQRDPFAGIGKPEPLRHELAGCWSRRIDQEHRLVYQVLPDKIRISRLPVSLLELRTGFWGLPPGTFGRITPLGDCRSDLAVTAEHSSR